MVSRTIFVPIIGSSYLRTFLRSVVFVFDNKEVGLHFDYLGFIFRPFCYHDVTLEIITFCTSSSRPEHLVTRFGAWTPIILEMKNVSF